MSSTKYEFLEYEKSDCRKIARITLNRPECRNAQNYAAVCELGKVASEICYDPDIRVVVLDGYGKGFCASIDLKELHSREMRQEYFEKWEDVLRLFEMMRPLVLCMMHGFAIGGGLQLGLACDIRIATPNTRISLPAAKDGLIPGLAIWRLSRYIGLGKAKRMILSGEEISGTEGFFIGLVDYLSDSDEYYQDVSDKIVQNYLGLCSEGARLAKEGIWRTQDSNFESAKKIYLGLQDRALASSDFFEARKAYIEKREPVWRC